MAQVERTLPYDVKLLTVRSAGNSVENLRSLAATTRDFQEIVNHEVYDIWAKVIKNVDLDAAFQKRDSYVIRRALEALEWYNYEEDVVTYEEGKPVTIKERVNAEKIDGIPDVATYDFCRGFEGYLEKLASTSLKWMNLLWSLIISTVL